VPPARTSRGEHAGRVRAVVESMNGARFVHDTLEAQGWDVYVADAQRVKGLAPLACKTDKLVDGQSPPFGEPVGVLQFLANWKTWWWTGAVTDELV